MTVLFLSVLRRDIYEKARKKPLALFSQLIKVKLIS